MNRRSSFEGHSHRGSAGPLMIGLLFGAACAVTAILLGFGAWAALAAYMVGGAIGVMAGGIASTASRGTSQRHWRPRAEKSAPKSEKEPSEA
jgi:hypothetical protein